MTGKLGLIGLGNNYCPRFAKLGYRKGIFGRPQIGQG